MRGGTVRSTTVAGVLAVAMLSALGTSSAAASDATETPSAEEPTAEPVEPSPDPLPEPATAPPLATAQPSSEPTPEPKPKPTPTPKPKTKPKPKPTPGEKAPGPKPVQSDEAPAAPVLPDPGTAGGLPPADGEPGVPAGPPSGGPGPSEPTGQGAPLPGVAPPPSRVQLAVAGATVSGIAAVTAWLILGGRRRKRAPVRVSRASGATVTLADDTQVDLEVVLNRPNGAPPPRYAGRVPEGSAPIWRQEDDRPRWLRRLDEQRPERPRARRPSVPPDDESMPWLAGVTWPDGDGGTGRGGDERN